MWNWIKILVKQLVFSSPLQVSLSGILFEPHGWKGGKKGNWLLPRPQVTTLIQSGRVQGGEDTTLLSGSSHDYFISWQLPRQRWLLWLEEDMKAEWEDSGCEGNCPRSPSMWAGRVLAQPGWWEHRARGSRHWRFVICFMCGRVSRRHCYSLIHSCKQYNELPMSPSTRNMEGNRYIIEQM